MYFENTYANFKTILADLKYKKQTNVHVILLDLEYVYILETVGQQTTEIAIKHGG